MAALVTHPELAVLPAGAPVRVESKAGDVVVHVPAGCEASLIENYGNQTADPYTTQSQVRIHLEPGAKLAHYKVVREGAAADHHSFVEAEVAQGASFQSQVFLLSGRNVRNTLHVRLNGSDAECSLNGLYVVNGEQRVETHTLIEHLKPRGTSRELYKGVLDDKAQGLFDGLIIVGKEAQKTDSAQKNQNLLLSPTAKALSNPELKILANDVKCKHGSTIGQIDPSQLFYLRSRGVPLAEARRLLIHAFASEMIGYVNLASLREELEKALALKFRS